MFSKKFMQNFALRKYGNPTAAGGNINSEFSLFGKRNKIPFRIGVFVFGIFLAINSSYSFAGFYEIIHHVHPPPITTFMYNDVPKDILEANLQIIQRLKLIQQGRKIRQSVINP